MNRGVAVLGTVLVIGAPAAAQESAITGHANRPAACGTCDWRTAWSLLDTTAQLSDVVAPASLSVAALVVYPLDRSLAHLVRSPALQDNRMLQGAARVFDFWGGAGVFIASGGALLGGIVANNDRAGDFGAATGKALIAGTIVTGTLKIVIGRARPQKSPDHNPSDFGFGRGLRNDGYRSLPSGHATAAFAFASAASRQLARTRTGGVGVDRPALYAAASLVALTRMYQDKHWASDVLLGAAIGTAAGVLVVR